MTGYLLDRDVLGAFENPVGNKNVHRWVENIPDDDLFVSAITVMEGWKGFVRLRRKARAPKEIAEINDYEQDFKSVLAGFGDRILPIDRAVAFCWGDMLAVREANTMDAGLAATAHVHGLIVATRNLRHFRDRGVPMLDPFKADPKIEVP